jgi:hypothetical protein
MSKKYSDDLFNLVKTLTKSEKRHFKIFAARSTGGDDNNNIRLFDAMDAEDEYNEEEFKSKFKKQAFSKNLATNKNRLYETILKSLQVYHAGSSIDAQLSKGLHNIEILYKKTLYSQSLKQLRSIKKLAEKHAKNAILMEVNRWEKLLLEKDNYENIKPEDIDSIFQYDQAIEKKVATFNLFWNIKSHVFYSLNKKGKPRTETELDNFKKFIDKNLLQIKESDHTHETKYLFHHIYSAYYFSIGDYSNCYEHLKSNIDHIEKNKHLFSSEPNIYFSVLTNAIYVGSSLRKYLESFALLTKLRALPEKMNSKNNEDLSLKLFSSIYSIELSLYSMLGDFEEGVKIIPQVTQGLEKYDDKLNSVRKAYFYFKIAEMFIGVEDYSKAQRWLNKLLNDINISEKEDIYCFAKLLSLIVHIELDNERIIPYALKSAYRYLKSRNRVYKFETVVFKFISKILRAKDSKDIDEANQFLDKELTLLTDDNFEKSAFEYFDFQSWAKSKVNKCSFKELVKKKSECE